MTKIHFQNLRSKNFGFFFGQKIENLKFQFFLIDFSKKHFSRKKIGRKIFFDRFFSRIFFLRKVNLKNENFKFSIFCPKKIPKNFDLKF